MLLRPLLTSVYPLPDSQISRGKTYNLHSISGEYTFISFGRLGLFVHPHDRPLIPASHSLFVHRITVLLCTSFSGFLAVDTLCFARPSGLPAWSEDFHLQVIRHARRTDAADKPRQVGKSVSLITTQILCPSPRLVRGIYLRLANLLSG